MLVRKQSIRIEKVEGQRKSNWILHNEEVTKKFIVYRDGGKTDKETGEIVAKKIEWGDPNSTIKNDDPGRAANFWSRHGCDQKKKMDPTKAGFWACYGPTLFGKQLGIKSDSPW